MLPGQEQVIDVDYDNGDLVPIEVWVQNYNPDWPPPELERIQNGQFKIVNTTFEPIVQ